jgi:hypothetical protein
MFDDTEGVRAVLVDVDDLTTLGECDAVMRCRDRDTLTVALGAMGEFESIGVGNVFDVVWFTVVVGPLTDGVGFERDPLRV